MISALLSRIVILVFGTLYPAYSSYKAVKTKDIKLYVKWMMYWIVFALFITAETFTDIFLGFWFPFYYEMKIILVIWLLSPVTRGSSIMYRKVIHPLLLQREREIDELLVKAKEQGYHVILDMGCKGMSLATNVILNTAAKNVTSPVLSRPTSRVCGQGDQTDGWLAPTENAVLHDVEAFSAAQFQCDYENEEAMAISNEDENVKERKSQPRRTRRSRKRESSTSRTRVTRSKKKVIN